MSYAFYAKYIFSGSLTASEIIDGRGVLWCVINVEPLG
jgi:hypothetical protein